MFKACPLLLICVFLHSIRSKNSSLTQQLWNESGFNSLAEGSFGSSVRTYFLSLYSQGDQKYSSPYSLSWAGEFWLYTRLEVRGRKGRGKWTGTVERQRCWGVRKLSLHWQALVCLSYYGFRLVVVLFNFRLRSITSFSTWYTLNDWTWDFLHVLDHWATVMDYGCIGETPSQTNTFWNYALFTEVLSY